jgi:hypothetical protein
MLLSLSCATFLTAQPGSGIRLDDFTTLTPKVNVSINYDDNINLRQRALAIETDSLSDNESDTFFEYLFSLALNRRVNNKALTASAYVGQELYQDFSELDSEKYGASLGYLWASSSGKTTVDVSGSYQFTIDETATNEETGLAAGQETLENFEDVSSRVERDILTASLALNQEIGTDLGTALRFGLNDTDYAEERFNDRTATDYEAELNYQVSPKTEIFGTVGYKTEDDEGFAEDSENPFVLAGARYSPTTKSKINAAVGYESYTITPLVTTSTRQPNGEITTETGAGEEQDDDGMKFRISAVYSMNPKTTLVLTGRNGYASQGTENSRPKRETAAVVSLRHRTTEQFSQRLGVTWREDDFIEPITIDEVEYDETRDTVSYFYSFTYRTARPWLTFFGRVSYEDGTSNLPDSRNEFDQTRASLGARLRY